MRAIRHLVASAVNGLKPQRVSIVDEAGHLLADGAGDDDNVGDVSVDERRSRSRSGCATRSRRSSPRWSVPGRARTQVSADFDFNRVTQTSDKFDPEGRVVRSSQTREETVREPTAATTR